MRPPDSNTTVQHSTARCCNSRTARTLRRVSALWSAASSSRYRWLNPLGNHRESGRPPTCSELACCGRPPPRVVIAVPTRGSALSSSHYRGANPSSSHYRGSTSSSSHYRGSTSSSCHYRGTNRGFSRLDWSAQPTLLSLSWYKPWFDVLLELLSWCHPLLESLSMVQTGGETLGGKWLCVLPSIL